METTLCRMTEGRQAPHQPTVLVVDDKPANLDVMLAHLADEGWRLLVATGGRDALRLARESRPDLILLDVMMPDLDGYAVLQQLQADADTRSTPVMLISAMADQVEEVRGLELGAVDYIGKPYSVPVLKARVRKALAGGYRGAVKTVSCRELMSRDQFMARTEREWQRCQRFRQPLSLLKIHIEVLGSHGQPLDAHTAQGELQGLVDKLRSKTQRASEIVGCMGHNLFAVLLPDIGAGQTQTCGLQLLGEMRDLNPLRDTVPKMARFCASIGAATVTPCVMTSPKQLLEAASQTLQEARQAGGNCIRS